MQKKKKEKVVNKKETDSKVNHQPESQNRKEGKGGIPDVDFKKLLGCG